MYWSLRGSRVDGAEDFSGQGRFVVHRHCDAQGAHIDLRLERDGHLEGFRVDGVSLEGETWATAKAPHPTRWLDQDGDAIRLDSGEYRWDSFDGESGTLLLQGEGGRMRLDVAREAGISASVAREIREAVREHGVSARDAVDLIRDGVTARRHATERLCGLGVLLDGEAFDDGLWRKTVDGLRLDEIHQQLRGFELRFDRMFPSVPVSQPETLNDEAMEARSGQALSILQD